MVEITNSRDIDHLHDFLPNYKGKVVHDSYTGWTHISFDEDHQMCILHQIRIPKKDLKYLNPKGSDLEFLTKLIIMLLDLYAADKKITDPKKRLVKANKFDLGLQNLIAKYEIFKTPLVLRYKKRLRREEKSLTTFLRKPDIPSTNNPVERLNKFFNGARSNGGGNRSTKGMKANSILFTVMLTDHLNQSNFFDHIVHALGGSGDG